MTFMTSWARSAVVALGAAASILVGTVGAPSAIASPLSDLLDGLDFGSSGPATGEPVEGDFLIDVPGLQDGTARYLSYRNVECLRDPIYSVDAFATEDSVLVQLISAECSTNRSEARFELVLADSGGVRFGAVDAYLRSGYVALFCVDTPRPGYVPLRCTANDEVVTFS